jgi:hypothetical protein
LRHFADFMFSAMVMGAAFLFFEAAVPALWAQAC